MVLASSSTAYTPHPFVDLSEETAESFYKLHAPSRWRRTVLESLQSAGTIVEGEETFQSSGTDFATGNIDRFIGFASANPFAKYVSKLAIRRETDRKIKSEVDARLRELRIDALLSGNLLSEASLRDLRAFLTPLTLAHRPAIFLLDNGNFRALWKNDFKEQVALQFLGGGLLQYVIFARRKNLPRLTTHAGNDTALNIFAQIAANSCEHLLFG